MPETDRPIYSIGAVARMLDLPPATIRTWETRYGLVVPERTPGGQRLYRPSQVDQLRFLKDQVADGARPGEAHRLLAARAPGPDAALRRLLERAGVAIQSDAEVVAFGCAAAEASELARRLEGDGHRVVALVATRQPPVA